MSTDKTIGPAVANAPRDFLSTLMSCHVILTRQWDVPRIIQVFKVPSSFVSCARVPLICHKTVGNAISSLGAVVLSRNASLCFCLAAILQGKIWPLAFRCSAVHGANSCLYVAASANHNLELFCLGVFVFRRCAVAPTPLHVLRGHRSLVFHIGWLPYRGAVGVSG